ncbi:MAG: STAS domain-containing protein [Acidobacteriota bacterium]|nr:MAG: STAS domain-containing protein [Acidobacteriota bacterium]
MHQVLKPKLLTVIQAGYTKKLFFADLTAGITVGVVALPLSIALAIASGAKPEQGLITAIIAGFVIAVLGGSRTQISGPTGAFIVIVYGIIQQYGYQGLVVATLIAGVLLILMGLFRMGALLKFVPYPVTVGFTSGIALLIFSSQLGDFLGLGINQVPADFVEKWISYGANISTLNRYSLLVGIASVLVIVYWSKITHRIPGMLVAIVLMTIAVQYFNIPVDTIQSRFGDVPNSFPTPHLPLVDWQLVKKMFAPGVTLALLAGLESLLSSVVADGMLGTRHRSNMELVAQGAGNIASVAFGGLPATGAIARTATNIKNGGRTPVAAVVHCVVLLVIFLFAGQWASLIPLATLAAVLIVVAYNMSEWREFLYLSKSTKSDLAVLLITFFLTVLVDLTTAIQVGVLLAAFLYLQRMSTNTQLRDISENFRERDDSEARDMSKISIPPGVEAFEIYGSLFFGAVEHFRDALRRVSGRPRVLILRMRDVLSIDASGLHSLSDLHNDLQRHGTVLVFSAISPPVFQLMKRSGFVDSVGKDKFGEDIFQAIEISRRFLAEETAEVLDPEEPSK